MQVRVSKTELDPLWKHMETLTGILKGLSIGGDTEGTTNGLQAFKEELMATAQDFDGLVTRLNTATNTLADQLKKLRDNPPSGMTQAQEDALAAQLEGPIKALEGMGKDPQQPVPPVQEGSSPATVPPDSPPGSRTSSSGTSNP
jgi:ABC-type transporter Mla subunit MlaD